MLYNYITEHFHEAEPIFFSDLLSEEYADKPALNKELKKLCISGKLEKYDTGIYYLPKKSRLGVTLGPGADMVAEYKYIRRNGKIYGFYTGSTLANQMGISTQVPVVPEIVSNKMSAKVREVRIGNRPFLIRRPVTEVDDENVHVLQMLDMLKNVELYLEEDYGQAAVRFEAYINKFKISRDDVDCYIRKYPLNTFKNYYEMGLSDVLA